MESSLQPLVGREVVVFTHNGGGSFSDHGEFLAFDGLFVTLRSGDDTLYFPYTAIRLIKPVN